MRVDGSGTKTSNHLHCTAGSSRSFTAIRKDAGLYCRSRLRKGEVFAYVGLPHNLKDLKDQRRRVAREARRRCTLPSPVFHERERKRERAREREREGERKRKDSSTLIMREPVMHVTRPLFIPEREIEREREIFQMREAFLDMCQRY